MKKLVVFLIVMSALLLLWQKQKNKNSVKSYPSPAFSEIIANPRKYDTVKFSGWVTEAYRFAGKSLYQVHDKEGYLIYVYTSKPAPEKGMYLKGVTAVPHQLLKFKDSNVFVFEEIVQP